MVISSTITQYWLYLNQEIFEKSEVVLVTTVVLCVHVYFHAMEIEISDVTSYFVTILYCLEILVVRIHSGNA